MPDLILDLRPNQVLRCLGYGGRRKPSARVEGRLAALWEEAVGLLAPRGEFRVVARADAARAGMPTPAETVGLGLCTAGGALEEESRRRSEEGAPLDALILDAVGSAAAEAAADALNGLLCAEAGRLGLYAARRVSPGYGKWDVRGQAELLALLPARDLGVSLTEGLMMIPRKSVSFAVNFLKSRPRGYGDGSRCARCGLRSCPYAERDELIPTTEDTETTEAICRGCDNRRASMTENGRALL